MRPYSSIRFSLSQVPLLINEVYSFSLSQVPHSVWSETLVGVIEQCWHQNPDRRHHFTDVCDILNPIAEAPPVISACDAMDFGGGDCLDSLSSMMKSK